jgi:hypothetical protein
MGRWGERLLMGEMGGMDRDGGRVSLGVLGGEVVEYPSYVNVIRCLCGVFTFDDT